MKGKQIYLSVSEINALCDFFNSFEEISPDEETYAYWLLRIGEAQYKIFDARDKLSGRSPAKNGAITPLRGYK